MFSMPMMASSTRTPSATANPPSVMVLSVRPMRFSTDGGQQRQRDGHEGDQCRTHVAQKQIEHRQNENRRNGQRVLEIAQSPFDEIRGPMQARIKGDALRLQGRLQIA